MSREPLAHEMVDAVILGDVERIAALLDAGADVNARNGRGETAFSFACAYDCLAAAQLLFRRGADVNSVDEGGGAPLDWAVCQSSPEFREWLVGVGGRRHDDTYEPWPWPPKVCSDSPCRDRSDESTRREDGSSPSE